MFMEVLLEGPLKIFFYSKFIVKINSNAKSIPLEVYIH
jgi:hypothetical protein